MLRLLLYRFVSLLIIFSLLVLSTPASPAMTLAAFSTGYQDFRFSLLSSRLAIDGPSAIAALFAGPGRVDRSRPISRIQIFPRTSAAGQFAIEKGEEITFAAIAYDQNNEPISGVPFEWEITDVGRGRPGRIASSSLFKAIRIGTFLVKARAGNREAEVRIVVRPTTNIRPRGTAIRAVSSRTGLGDIIGTTDDATITADSQGARKPERDKKYEKPQDQEQPRLNLLPGEGWDNTNWQSADDPGNQTGNPPGNPMDGGAGNGNFQLSAPVVSLPGRGIDLALNLNYNSRLWSKSGTQITYDADFGFPAPGWQLGFGRVIFMGSQGGCMILDADGTRRGYTGSVSSWSTGSAFTGHTADGSFIDYGCGIVYGGHGSAWAKLPNGTTVNYASAYPGNTHFVPTKITDAQGNFIVITYQNRPGENIETITDTLGRVITFNYDSLGRLIEIRAPRMQGQDPIYGTATTRTVMRIHYKALTLSYSFSGITPIARNGTPWVIDAIYYPATNTGYWFGDADSYSTYGMISKVVEQRGMSWSAGPDAQGTVTQGTMTKQADYNYPLTTANQSGRTNGIGLTDAPTYETLTESWAGADVAEPAVTTYKIQQDTSPRTTTVIQPNGAVSRQYSYKNPGQYNDGLVYLDESYVPDPNGSQTIPNVSGTFTLVAKSNVTWSNGTAQNYDSPRPTQAEVFDENNHKVKTIYTYGTNKFNQITRSCDYDNSDALLRCATAEYENDQSYTGQFNTNGQWQQFSGPHVFNLVKSTAVENSSGTRISRTDYEYDNYAAQPFTDAPGVIHHEYWYNAFTTVLIDGPNCLEWGEYYQCGYYPEYQFCRDCLEYEQISAYQPTTEKRGNITKITAYADAATPSGAIVETRAYDITGNMVKTSSACCEQISILYDNPNTVGVIDTQYAYPVSQTRGAADPNSPHRITTSQIVDFDTGLVISATDANGRTSTTGYHPDTMRPMKSTSSTGAYSTMAYDDAAMTVTEETKEASGTLAGKTVKYLNGVGQVRKEEAYAPSSIVDVVETLYTKFGEEWKQSRPYRAGETIYWSERFYDSQRRLIKVVEPDGSETKAFYNEAGLPDSVTAQPGNRIRVMDAWGRDRWGRYDQQGRLIQVVEPNPDKTANPNGSVFVTGSLLTAYSYDTQNRLVQTNQGAQVRKFKYDDLGRLTHQKLAEQTATLNDAGAYVGAGQTGANWSNAFFYDGRSNLTQKTDARGVKSLYSYTFFGGGEDPLNRLQMVSYDHSGPLDTSVSIYAAQPTSYGYMTTGDKTRVQGIYTQAILAEEFAYDVEGRVSTNTKTVQYRPYHPFETSYLYDTLDRVKEVTYPAQYGIPAQGGDPANPRKIVTHSYDSASRLTGMTYGTAVSSVQQASDIVYNASDQTTQMKVGAAGANQVTEEYTFDAQTGLLTNQKAIRNGGSLLDLSYSYNRENSAGNLSGKTGHLTKIIDNLNTNKNREYEFDALGRLTKAKGGATGTLWNQTYSYDRYGNRTNVTASGVAADNSPIPIDGIPNLAYDNTSNRITTAGYQYDVNGNLIRSLAEDMSTWVTYEYDSANRLRKVRKDDTNQTVLQEFEYAADNARLLSHDPTTNQWSIYASTNGTVFAEYTEFSPSTPTWVKSYTYLGDKQLSTITPNGQGGEYTEYNHPDKLGTRLITNQAAGTSYEQVNLPFGTALNAESTIQNNNRRFTSYDRSSKTGLDYAINRTYDSKLGRFTQVDPIDMQAVDLKEPQTLNLYTYAGNDPINHVDPDGLFFGKLFKWLGKVLKSAFKWIAVAISVAIAVLTIVYAPILFAASLKQLLGIIAAVANAAQSVLSAAGLNKAAAVFGIISSFASLGTAILDFRAAAKAFKLKALFSVVSNAATAVSRTLTAFGHQRLGRIFGLISTVTGFIGEGLKETNKGSLKWDPSSWDVYKFVRSSSEQIANIAGATRLAGYLNVLGIVDDLYDSYRGIKNFLKNNVGGGDKVYELDFRRNQRRELSGLEELNARFSILIVNVLRRSNQQAGRVNSIIRRVERGTALAR